jgi:hypothetical protein
VFGSLESSEKNVADIAGGALFGERLNGEVVNATFLENLATQ